MEIKSFSTGCNGEWTIKMCYGDDVQLMYFGILRAYVRIYVDTFRNTEQGV